MTPKKLYLSGPMTGLPENNYPTFNRYAAELRAKGYEVLNPAENTAPPCGSWQGYMRRALSQLIQCDGVALIDGWNDSKGASLELRVASNLDIPYRGVDVILDAPKPWITIVERLKEMESAQ